MMIDAHGLVFAFCLWLLVTLLEGALVAVALAVLELTRGIGICQSCDGAGWIDARFIHIDVPWSSPCRTCCGIGWVLGR